MKTKMIFLLITVFTFNAAHAQQQRVIGGAGFMRFGYTGAPGTAEVFTQIAPRGVDGFSNNYMHMGGDAYFRYNRLTLGFDGSAEIQGVYSQGRRYASPFIGTGHFRVGFVAAGDERCWFYPTFGIGPSAIVLNTWRKSASGDEYENWHSKILLSPSFDLGLNVDFAVTNSNKAKPGFGGFIMGIRTGYRFSYGTDNWWNEEGVSLDNMPSYQGNVFYIGVAIGGGWFVKKGEKKPEAPAPMPTPQN